MNSRAELRCEAAKALEYKGEYEKAGKLLSDYWPRVGERPKLGGLDQSTAAEVLLRVGVLTGWISGSVTYAARRLGISVQALTYMLNTRHKDLLKYRTLVRRRQRKEKRPI